MDEKILQQIQRGDHKAFAQLYEEYANYALRVAMAITRDRASAADAVQETFVRIYRNIGSYDMSKDFKPWFYKILVNECNRVMKNKGKIVLISEYVDKYENMARDDTYQLEQYESLYQALQQLDEINRVPIILKYLMDFSEKEIADILTINLNTLKSRLLKGRQKLRTIVEQGVERGGRHG